MTVDAELLEILVCPNDRGEVDYLRGRAGHRVPHVRLPLPGARRHPRDADRRGGEARDRRRRRSGDRPRRRRRPCAPGDPGGMLDIVAALPAHSAARATQPGSRATDLPDADGVTRRRVLRDGRLGGRRRRRARPVRDRLGVPVEVQPVARCCPRTAGRTRSWSPRRTRGTRRRRSPASARPWRAAAASSRSRPAGALAAEARRGRGTRSCRCRRRLHAARRARLPRVRRARRARGGGAAAAARPATSTETVAELDGARRPARARGPARVATPRRSSRGSSATASRSIWGARGHRRRSRPRAGRPSSTRTRRCRRVRRRCPSSTTTRSWDGRGRSGDGFVGDRAPSRRRAPATSPRGSRCRSTIAARGRRATAEEVRAAGRSALARLLSLILIGDFTSHVPRRSLAASIPRRSTRSSA